MLIPTGCYAIALAFPTYHNRWMATWSNSTEGIYLCKYANTAWLPRPPDCPALLASPPSWPPHPPDCPSLLITGPADHPDLLTFLAGKPRKILTTSLPCLVFVFKDLSSLHFSIHLLASVTGLRTFRSPRLWPNSNYLQQLALLLAQNKLSINIW